MNFAVEKIPATTSSGVKQGRRSEWGAAIVEVREFNPDRKEHCSDILKEQEISGYAAVMRIANTVDIIKSIVNLRVVIMPIVDMRIKFRLGGPNYRQFIGVIILNIAGRVVGKVVDSMADVIPLRHRIISSPRPEWMPRLIPIA